MSGGSKQIKSRHRKTLRRPRNRSRCPTLYVRAGRTGVVVKPAVLGLIESAVCYPRPDKQSKQSRGAACRTKLPGNGPSNEMCEQMPWFPEEVGTVLLESRATRYDTSWSASAFRDARSLTSAPQHGRASITCSHQLGCTTAMSSLSARHEGTRAEYRPSSHPSHWFCHEQEQEQGPPIIRPGKGGKG